MGFPQKSSQPEIPNYIRQVLKRMNPKEREELLTSLLHGGDQRLGFFNKDSNTFFEII